MMRTILYRNEPAAGAATRRMDRAAWIGVQLMGVAMTAACIAAQFGR